MRKVQSSQKQDARKVSEIPKEDKEKLKTKFVEDAVKGAQKAARGSINRPGFLKKKVPDHHEHRELAPRESHGSAGFLCNLPQIVDVLVDRGAYTIANTLQKGIEHTPWGIREAEIEEIIAEHYLFAYVIEPNPNILPRGANPAAGKVWKDVFRFYGELIEHAEETEQRWAVAIATYMRRCARLNIDPFLSSRKSLDVVKEEEAEKEKVPSKDMELLLTHVLRDAAPDILDEILSAASDQGLVSDFSDQPNLPGGRDVGTYTFVGMTAGEKSEGVYDYYLHWAYPFDVGDKTEDLDDEAMKSFLGVVDFPLEIDKVTGDEFQLTSPILDGVQCFVTVGGKSNPEFTITLRLWLSQHQAGELVGVEDPKVIKGKLEELAEDIQAGKRF